MIVRRARIEDAAQIAAVHVETWRMAYAGMLPDKFLLNLSAKDHESRWWRHVLTGTKTGHFVYVAEDAEAGVVGFCTGGPTRGDKFAFDAEVYTLYLLDRFQGRGIGKSLFLELALQLKNTGSETLLVWVLDQNPSRFFYSALGGVVGITRNGSVGGKKIRELGYCWSDIDQLLERRGTGAAEINNQGN